MLYLLKLVDEFPDTVGFARIVQALQATEWPDLQMKGSKLIRGAPELSSGRLVPAGSSIFEGSGSGRNR